MRKDPSNSKDVMIGNIVITIGGLAFIVMIIFVIYSVIDTSIEHHRNEKYYLKRLSTLKDSVNISFQKSLDYNESNNGINNKVRISKDSIFVVTKSVDDDFINCSFETQRILFPETLEEKSRKIRIILYVSGHKNSVNYYSDGGDAIQVTLDLWIIDTKDSVILAHDEIYGPYPTDLKYRNGELVSGTNGSFPSTQVIKEFIYKYLITEY